MLVDSLDCSDASTVAPPSDHHNFADVKLVPLVDLPRLQIDLDGVVRLDVRVWEADCTCVVCRKIGHTLVSEEDLLDSAELEAGLVALDGNKGEAALDVVEDAEGLMHLRDLEDVHEADREGGVCARLAVDQDILVLEDHAGFSVGVSIVEAVTQDEDEWDALAEAMGAVCRSGGPDASHLV